MQVRARRDAVHCKEGCSALRGRLQCTASEMGKTGTEIASPILDYWCPLKIFGDFRDFYFLGQPKVVFWLL